jgi:Mn-containing catalase
MYHHVKKLMFTVRVDEPDVRFGNMLLEQFGGANGELAAAMQYSIQALNCEDPERRKRKHQQPACSIAPAPALSVGMRLEPRVE